MERGFAEVVLLDVEHRAQILTHPLALDDPHRLVGRLDAPGIRTVDDDAKNGADRLPSQLDVEDFQAVARGDTLGGGADPFDVLATRRTKAP